MIPEDDPHKSIYNKEDIELKLNKIDELEIMIEGIKSEIRVINKRIKRLQDDNDKLRK